MTDAELIKQLKEENRWLRRMLFFSILLSLVAMASEYIARHHA